MTQATFDDVVSNMLPLLALAHVVSEFVTGHAYLLSLSRTGGTISV